MSLFSLTKLDAMTTDDMLNILKRTRRFVDTLDEDPLHGYDGWDGLLAGWEQTILDAYDNADVEWRQAEVVLTEALKAASYPGPDQSAVDRFMTRKARERGADV